MPDYTQFSPAEFDELGSYVYIYSDPETDEPFYVGKGRGNRAFAHLKEAGESAKLNRIAEIEAKHMQPRIEILAFGLDEPTAFKVEAAAIDLIGFANLTNKVVGHGSAAFGRMGLGEVHARLQPKPLEWFDDDCVVIRVNRSVEEARERLGRRFDGESAESRMALYDATRSAWVIGEQRRRTTKLAFTNIDGVIREAYEIEAWLPAGSTMRSDQTIDRDPRRWEFVGRVAPEEVRKRYVLRSVSHLFKRGDINPLRFFGPSSPQEGAES